MTNKFLSVILTCCFIFSCGQVNESPLPPMEGTENNENNKHNNTVNSPYTSKSWIGLVAVIGVSTTVLALYCGKKVLLKQRSSENTKEVLSAARIKLNALTAHEGVKFTYLNLAAPDPDPQKWTVDGKPGINLPTDLNKYVLVFENSLTGAICFYAKEGFSLTDEYEDMCGESFLLPDTEYKVYPLQFELSISSPTESVGHIGNRRLKRYRKKTNEILVIHCQRFLTNLL